MQFSHAVLVFAAVSVDATNENLRGSQYLVDDSAASPNSKIISFSAYNEQFDTENKDSDLIDPPSECFEKLGISRVDHEPVLDVTFWSTFLECRASELNVEHYDADVSVQALTSGINPHESEHAIQVQGQSLVCPKKEDETKDCSDKIVKFVEKGITLGLKATGVGKRANKIVSKVVKNKKVKKQIKKDMRCIVKKYFQDSDSDENGLQLTRHRSMASYKKIAKGVFQVIKSILSQFKWSRFKDAIREELNWWSLVQVLATFVLYFFSAGVALAVKLSTLVLDVTDMFSVVSKIEPTCLLDANATSTSPTPEPDSADELEFHNGKWTGISVTDDRGYHHVGKGLYFSFDTTKWSEYFGSLTSGGYKYMVKQCRSQGGEIWSGYAVIGAAYGKWYGRRDTGAGKGDWAVGDTIVRSTASCELDRVGITDITGYHNRGLGFYFSFDLPNWIDAFGRAVNGEEYEVKQCNNQGREIWYGKAVIGIAYGEWYGRRATAPGAGNWAVGDVIVRPHASCLTLKSCEEREQDLYGCIERHAESDDPLHTSPRLLTHLVITPNDNTVWFPFADNVGQEGNITFKVKAPNDAHIALGSSAYQPNEKVVPNHYEVIIGGWSNSKSCLRLASQGSSCIVQVQGTYLSRSQFREFRIIWSSDSLTLYRSVGGQFEDMMRMNLTPQYIVDRALVMTGYGATGEWELISQSKEETKYPTYSPTDEPETGRKALNECMHSHSGKNEKRPTHQPTSNSSPDPTQQVDIAGSKDYYMNKDLSDEHVHCDAFFQCMHGKTDQCRAQVDSMKECWDEKMHFCTPVAAPSAAA